MESEILFSIIEALRDMGVSIYISTGWRGVYRLADRLTIVRDGENGGAGKRGNQSVEVIRLMIGKVVDESKDGQDLMQDRDEVALEVRDLSKQGSI